MAGLHYKFSKLNFKQVVVTTQFLHQVSLSTHFWWSSQRSEGVQPCSRSSDGKPLVCHDDICQEQHSAPPSDSSTKLTHCQHVKTQRSLSGTWRRGDDEEKKSISANCHCSRWRSLREITSLGGECPGCVRKPQRHLFMLCDIISLVKWLIYTFIARECSNHTEVITASIKRCFSARNSPYPATASHQMQGIPRQPGESSGMQSGKHRTVLDLLLCPRPLGRSRSVSNAVSHPLLV